MATFTTKRSKKQLSVVEKLIHQADTLVNAGDPDREGQLLVDEVFSYANLSAEKRNKILRCLISDLNPSAVEKRLKNYNPTVILFLLPHPLSHELAPIGFMALI